MLAALTDDQIALTGCAVALVVCGGLMWVSFFAGQFLRRRNEDHPARVLRFTAPPSTEDSRQETPAQHRRAA